MKTLCTNGVKSVVMAVQPAVERSAGTAIRLTWGSTVALTEALASGENADCIIVTAEAIGELIAGGKALSGTQVDIARSRIGLAVRSGAPKPDISSSEALK